MASALRVQLVEMKEIPPLAGLGSDLSLTSPRLSESCELVYLSKLTKHLIKKKKKKEEAARSEATASSRLSVRCAVTPAGDKDEQ